MQRIIKGTLVLIAAWLLVAVFFPNTVLPNSWFERFNTQAVHLRQVREHIASIQPQWIEFCRQHPEMSKVQLSEYTGGDGMIAVFGAVPTDTSLLVLSNFIQSTKPPRPLYIRAMQVWGEEETTNNLAPNNDHEP